MQYPVPANSYRHSIVKAGAVLRQIKDDYFTRLAGGVLRPCLELRREFQNRDTVPGAPMSPEIVPDAGGKSWITKHRTPGGAALFGRL
jgi:hypothetical protein